MDFGRWGGFPFTFGGEEPYDEQEYNAQRAALAPDGRGYNVDDDLMDIEIEAHSAALRLIWDVNERTANQAIPARMLEELTRWEEILRLRPAPTDSDTSRRAAVEAKLRGLIGNSIVDTEATSRAILGANFSSVEVASTANATAYWPGINPGPPGYEWSSNRLCVAVHMTRVSLTDEAVQGLITRLSDSLDAMLSVWMTYQIGVTGGFIAGVGIAGLTIL